MATVKRFNIHGFTVQHTIDHFAIKIIIINNFVAFNKLSFDESLRVYGLVVE
ncbi:MAG: hypothetical protein ACJAXJ_000326 [Colwellia sp.]|jgi:hypothetical protein